MFISVHRHSSARLRDCATVFTCDYDDECDEKKTGCDDRNQVNFQVKKNGFQTCATGVLFDQDTILKEPKRFRRQS
jgi:hypothetical protein